MESFPFLYSEVREGICVAEWDCRVNAYSDGTLTIEVSDLDRHGAYTGIPSTSATHAEIEVWLSRHRAEDLSDLHDRARRQARADARDETRYQNWKARHEAA